MQCSDEKLIELIRAGDVCAMETLLDRYKAIVKLKARRLFISGGDVNDLLQEGMIGLYKAIITYNPDKQVEFKHFANICIDGQIHTAIKKATRLKHVPLNDSLSIYDIEEVIAWDNFEIQNPENIVINNEELMQTTEKLKNMLSKLEYGVLNSFLEGKSYCEIADMIKKDVKSVDNALQRIKQKLKGIF